MIARVVFEFPPHHEGWAWEAGEVVDNNQVEVMVADVVEEWLDLPEGTWVELGRTFPEDADEVGLDVHAMLILEIGLVVEQWKVVAVALLR